MTHVTQEAGPTIGRFGLMVPEVAPTFDLFEGFDVLRFFEKFWALNRPGCVPSQRWQQRLKPYNERTSVNAEGDKPALIIQSLVTVVPPSDQRLSDQHRVKIGEELHTIHTLADTVGDLIPLVTASFVHETWHGSPTSRRTPSIREGNKWIIPERNAAEQADLRMEPEEYSAFVRERHSQAIQGVLERTVQLLS